MARAVFSFSSLMLRKSKIQGLSFKFNFQCQCSGTIILNDWRKPKRACSVALYFWVSIVFRNGQWRWKTLYCTSMIGALNPQLRFIHHSIIACIKAKNVTDIDVLQHQVLFVSRCRQLMILSATCDFYTFYYNLQLIMILELAGHVVVLLGFQFIVPQSTIPTHTSVETTRELLLNI